MWFPSVAGVLSDWRQRSFTVLGITRKQGAILPPIQSRFEPGRAVKLAALSFAVYGDAECERYYIANDGTHIGFPSNALLKQNFKCSLKANILQAKGLPKEDSMVERILNGQHPDPYVTINVKGKHGYDRGTTAVMDNNSDPVFKDQVFSLLVENPANADIEVVVKDKSNVLRGTDALVGQSSIPLRRLMWTSVGHKWNGWLDIKNQKGQNRGKVELALELAPLEVRGKVLLQEEVKDEGEEKTQEEAKAVEMVEEVQQEVKDIANTAAVKNTTSEAEQLDWQSLANTISDAAWDLQQNEMVIFFSNEKTDTQGGIWLNRDKKEMMIIFRGTEISSLRDLLTDIDIRQRPLTGKDDKRLIHAGFHNAFHSVGESVYTCIHFITQGNLNGWKIDVAGHSLGGALASLMAHSLAQKYPELPQSDRLNLYTYGAPRVGNREFCEDMNARVPHAYRIINNADVIPRIPHRRNPGSIFFEHFGWTVLLTNDALKQISIYLENTAAAAAAEQEEEKKEIVVEEIKEKIQRENVPVSAMAEATEGSPATVDDMMKVASNPFNLGAMIKAPLSGSFEAMKSKIKEAASKLLSTNIQSDGNVSQIMQQHVVVSANQPPEIIMVDSVFKSNVQDHLEPSYYGALKKAIEGLVKASSPAATTAAASGSEEGKSSTVGDVKG